MCICDFSFQLISDIINLSEDVWTRQLNFLMQLCSWQLMIHHHCQSEQRFDAEPVTSSIMLQVSICAV